MFHLFQAQKVADIPRWKRKIACFSFIFPHLFEFANNEPCAAGAPLRMKLILPYP
jgi:hypothetical protein